MRTIFSFLFLLVITSAFGQAIPGNNSPQYFFNGSLSVSKGNGAPANSSSYFEVGNGNDHKGILLPRINDTGSISNPIEGLFAYDKSVHSIKYYNGVNWKVAESSNISNSSLVANGEYSQNWNSHALSFYNLSNVSFTLNSGVFQVSGSGSYVINTPNISFIASGGSGPIVFSNPAGISFSTSLYAGVFSSANLTGNRSFQLPDTSGTLITQSSVDISVNNSKKYTDSVTLATSSNTKKYSDSLNLASSNNSKKYTDSSTLTSSSGLGDVTLAYTSIFLVGDSKTESQGNLGSGADRITSFWRQKNQPLEKLNFVVNWGGSGHTIKDWVEGVSDTLPFINLYTNLGVGHWDGYGHKPTGKTTLSTQIKWKQTNLLPTEKTLWVMGYPTNDVILYANNGNMSEDSLTEYLRGYIEQGVRKILAAFPNDKIILNIPCPMVARPDNPQFPSHTAYPSWGTNLSVDSAYMSKWNNSIRNAFYKVKGKFKNTEVYDSWLDAFGTVNTATSATLLPYMNDCVHQNNIGNWKIVDGWIGVAYKPRFKNQSRIQEADSRAALMGNNPWDNEPGYFFNNLKYKAVLYSPVTAVAGSNYIDLTMAKGDWDKYVNGSPVYISVGNSAAQYFATYSVSQTSGTTIRLTGVAPTTAFQAAIGEVVIYISATKLLSPDVYVLGRITALGPRFVVPGYISSAGSGYFDVRLDPVIGRPTTNILTGMNTARLVIGGTVDTDITDLTTGTTINQTGAASGRTMRILKTGDWTSYANTYCAFLFDDSAIPPTAYEARYPYFAQVLHAQNNIMRTAINQNLPAGVTINIANTEVFATNVTVEIFSVRYPNRTSLGIITIPANSGSASTPIVVSTNVPVKTIYEAVITSATSQTTGLITMTVTPN